MWPKICLKRDKNKRFNVNKYSKLKICNCKLRCSGRINNSCSTCGARCITQGNGPSPVNVIKEVKVTEIYIYYDTDSSIRQTLRRHQLIHDSYNGTFLYWKYLSNFIVRDIRFLLVILTYNRTCLMWPSKGKVKYGHIRQVVA